MPPAAPEPMTMASYVLVRSASDSAIEKIPPATDDVDSRGLRLRGLIMPKRWRARQRLRGAVVPTEWPPSRLWRPRLYPTLSIVDRKSLCVPRKLQLSGYRVYQALRTVRLTLFVDSNPSSGT